MFLSRLIYASRAAESLQQPDIEQILESSRRNNGRVGVTGLLVFSAREFLQCLEGSREAVNQTYARILGDPRHAEVQVLDYREVAQRLFPDWGMHGLAPSLMTRQRVLRYSERELFTPTRMSAAAALALLEELSGALVEATRTDTTANARASVLAKLRAGGG